MEATKLLVDDHHGIYCWKVLVSNYEVYVMDYDKTIEDPKALPVPYPLEGWLESRPEWSDETPETIFNPDNSRWCENLDSIEAMLAVRDIDGTMWSVDQIEGAIYAVNPQARWDEEGDYWTLEPEEEGEED